MNRWDDVNLKKIVGLWPIILAGIVLVGSYYLKSAAIETTFKLANQTAAEMALVKTEQAVQREMISAVREDQTEIKRDIKQILRAVR